MSFSLSLRSKDPANELTDSYRDQFTEFSSNHPRGSVDEATNNGTSSHGGKSALSNRLSNLSELISFLDREDGLDASSSTQSVLDVSRTPSTVRKKQGKGKSPMRLTGKSTSSDAQSSPIFERMSINPSRRKNHSANDISSNLSLSYLLANSVADPLPSPSKSEPSLSHHQSANATVENTLVRNRKGAVAPTPSRALEAYQRIKREGSHDSQRSRGLRSRITSNQENTASSSLTPLDSPTPQRHSISKIDGGNDSSTGETKDSIARVAAQAQEEFESIVRNSRSASHNYQDRFTPDIQIQQAANASRDYLKRREQLSKYEGRESEDQERSTEEDLEDGSELFRWRERVQNVDEPRDEEPEKVRLDMEMELRRSRDEVERLKSEVRELKETLTEGLKRRRTETGDSSKRNVAPVTTNENDEKGTPSLPFQEEAFFNVLKHLIMTISSDYRADLSSIDRSLQFVRVVDSVVWKKKSGSNSDTIIFQKENLQALEERLMVWERLVRS